jgi:hypothetical protein
MHMTAPFRQGAGSQVTVGGNRRVTAAGSASKPSAAIRRFPSISRNRRPALPLVAYTPRPAYRIFESTTGTWWGIADGSG